MIFNTYIGNVGDNDDHNGKDNIDNKVHTDEKNS